jgi:hypothetical protein
MDRGSFAVSAVPCRQAGRWSLASSYTASEMLARLKFLTFIAGTTTGVPTDAFSLAATRTGRPNISTFASISAND